MSDYVSKKAIRYKFKKELTEDERMNMWDRYMCYNSHNSLKEDYKLENNMEYDTAVNYDNGKSEDYLDIVLKSTYGTICGDFGNSRMLTKEEIDKYLPDFKKVIPEITGKDLRYVFFCYYNGVDAPSCYEVGEWDND